MQEECACAAKGVSRRESVEVRGKRYLSQYLAVHVQLAHAPRDQVRVLRAEVEDGDLLLLVEVLRGHGAGAGAGAAGAAGFCLLGGRLLGVGEGAWARRGRE